ncbi:YitT family protein [Carboxylicivirga sediminis]|uniref:YitT family protein n=1 Tax=Carboxylicivirga sediminis TaxID=2006564 RepID=A0A941IUG2_9BACT|nr:YitT family protein [Carboxylicivirga sediminis]MBR8534255.1 YitT family protein [Carboxylicivirga sediminis]
MTKSVILKEAKSYAIITLGLMVSAIGWTGFIIPSDIVGGGVMGLSSLLYFIFDLPVGPTNLVLNGVLILLSMRILGKGFGIKTIYSLVTLSVFITVFPYFITEPIVTDRFMAAIIGGGLVGASIGILFVQGGSTGGTEIIAMMINKNHNISPGRIMVFCDIFIISSSFIVFESLETMVFGFVVVGLMSYIADMLLTGSRQSVQILIISQKPKEIADKLSSQINRGLSFLKGRGYYYAGDREFIITIVKKSESHMVFQIIKETDPDAFISVANVMAVYGAGFDQYKPPLNSKKSTRPKNTEVRPVE